LRLYSEMGRTKNDPKKIAEGNGDEKGKEPATENFSIVPKKLKMAPKSKRVPSSQEAGPSTEKITPQKRAHEQQKETKSAKKRRKEPKEKEKTPQKDASQSSGEQPNTTEPQQAANDSEATLDTLEDSIQENPVATQSDEPEPEADKDTTKTETKKDKKKAKATKSKSKQKAGENETEGGTATEGKSKKKKKKSATKSDETQGDGEGKSPEKKKKKTSASQGGKTEKRRVKFGVKTLQSIRKLQSSTNLLVPAAPFVRLVRQITHEVQAKTEAFSSSKDQFRFTTKALEALQEATEAYITGFFEDMNLCALHARRVTITPRDMHLVNRFRNPTLANRKL